MLIKSYDRGGTDKIASRAIEKLSKPVQRGKRVTAIIPVGVPGKKVQSVKLTINNKTQAEYHHVVSTIPFGCLRLVDTSQCNFSWDLQTAIRTLHYDGSTKVAIQFKSRWWEKLPAPQIGGVSSTDRPTRTVVYPSYGLHGEAATMIVSYTWAQDAFRTGAMAQGKGSAAETALLDVILKDLTDMHHIKDAHGKPDYAYLRGLMKDYHVWNWYSNEFSMGKPTLLDYFPSFIQPLL
jgi:monoamine oxidase